MVSRRKVLAGMLAGGTGLAGAVMLTSREARRWVFGPTSFTTAARPLAIPESMGGELRDGVRTYDLGLQRGLSR